MLVDEVARPKKFRLPSGNRLKSTAELRRDAATQVTLSVVRAEADASDEGRPPLRFLHEERAVARTTFYSSGAREAEAGAGTSSSLLNGLAQPIRPPQLGACLRSASLVSYRPRARQPKQRAPQKSDIGRVRAAAQQHSSLFYSHTC